MVSLLIETSTERGVTAILDKSKILFCSFLPFGYQNSGTLLPEIEKGLKNLKLTLADFHYIAVGVGPGSYTGIRIGATVAKTLAFPHQIPLIGISTLQTFIPDKEGEFAVLIDAKIGGVYFIRGIKRGQEILYLSTPEVISLENIRAKLQGVSLLVTPQCETLRPKIDKLYPGCAWEWQERAPDVAHMGLLAQSKFDTKEYSTEGVIELQYLRKTQAELEKEQKKQMLE